MYSGNVNLSSTFVCILDTGTELIFAQALGRSQCHKQITQLQIYFLGYNGLW